MRIAFLGTPEFAVPSLDLLRRRGHTLAVFTQPDKPVGRKAILTPPPVKVYAEQYGIPVYQFERIKRPEGVEALRAFAPDLMVTAAFGQILSKENLDVPKLGCINVHGSLLPKYRGAAPIQWSVINGENETGITTMLTDIGMDTGDMLLTTRVEILPDETAGELYDRLAAVGAETLGRTLDLMESGELVRIPQNHDEATVCPMLKKEHGKVDFSQSAVSVHNRVRGTNPWPGAYALIDGEALKLWKTRIVDGPRPEGENGTILGDGKKGMFVLCENGVIEVLEVQAVGGKRLDGKTFLRGKPIAGKILK